MTRPAVFALPTRAELKRAMRLSLIVTLVSMALGLILPVAPRSSQATRPSNRFMAAPSRGSDHRKSLR